MSIEPCLSKQKHQSEALDFELQREKIPVGDHLLHTHELLPDLYLGWCPALGSVRFSGWSLSLPEFLPWSGAVITEDARLWLPPYPGLFSISPSQSPVDPDKPCPPWCLQSTNTCGHLCCPGGAGRTSPFCLSLSPGFASVQHLSSWPAQGCS